MKHNQDNKPNVVVCLGDLFEAGAASKWSKENTAELIEEYEKGNDVLKRIRLVNPNAKYVFLEGNHDANINAEGRLPADLRDLTNYLRPQFKETTKDTFVQVNSELLNEWNHSTRYIKHRVKGCFRIGAVCFAHGFEAGTNSDELEAIYWSQYWANGLVVRGHTHRPTVGSPRRSEKTKKLQLPFYYLNAGCSCDMSAMTYMNRNDRSKWGNGFVFGSCQEIKSPRLSKTWTAECVVTEWFDC
jgi:predicted phosphodiesterase